MKIFLLIITFFSVYSIEIITTNEKKHIFTPAFSGNKSPIINGTIISYIGVLGTTMSDLQRCDKAPKNAYLNQSIAVIASYGGCSTERHIEVVQEAGAIAAIVITSQLWKICHTKDYHSSRYNNKIPAVCMSVEDFMELSKILQENGNLRIFLTCEDYLKIRSK